MDSETIHDTSTAMHAAHADVMQMFTYVAAAALVARWRISRSAFDVDMSSQTHAVSTRMLCVDVLDGKLAIEE